MRKLITLIFSVLFGLNIHSQTTITIGTREVQSVNTPTANSQYIGPYNYYWKSNRLQFVYLASEIIAAGGSPGTISSIAWDVSELITGDLLNYTVRMAHTSATDASNHNAAPLTTVVNPHTLTPGTLGWRTLTFNNNFEWNGIDNLLIDVCWGMNEDYKAKGKVWLYNKDIPNQTIAKMTDSQYCCNLNTIYVYKGKPRVQFTITPSIYTWTGATSTEWAEASNWSKSLVPNALISAVIPAAPVNQPHVTNSTSSPAACNNLTIENGAILTIDGGKALSVSGTLTNNAGTSGLIIEDGGSLILNTNNVSATVKRNITGNNQFHLFSSPVQNATLSNVFPMAQHNNIWVRSYDEATGAWINRTTADAMTPGTGYSVVSDLPSTIATWQGALNVSPLTETLSMTGSSGNSNYDGWNLLGNPFTCALDRDQGSWNPTNVEPAIYVYNNGNYLSWNGFGSLTDGIIPQGQGFFMKATANNGTVDIPATAKVHSSQGFYKAIPANTLRIDVTNADNTYTDALIIRFAQGSTEKYDATYDARKLRGLTDAPEIWCPGEVPTSLNTLPSIETNPEVGIAFKPAGNTQHTLTFSGLESFDYSGPVMLIDMVNGSQTDLRNHVSYSFMASTNDPENRFKIAFTSVGMNEFNPLDAITAWYTAGHIFLANLPKHGCMVSLYSVDGKHLLNSRMAPQQNQLAQNLSTGIYLLKITDGSNVCIVKLLVN